MEKHINRSDYDSTKDMCDVIDMFFRDCPNSSVIIDDMTDELASEMEAFGFAGEPPADFGVELDDDNG